MPIQVFTILYTHSSLLTKQIKHVSVVGAGTLGCEIAAHIKEAAPSVEVTQVYAEPGAMHRHLPEYMRAYVTAILRNKVRCCAVRYPGGVFAVLRGANGVGSDGPAEQASPRLCETYFGQRPLMSQPPACCCAAWRKR